MQKADRITCGVLLLFSAYVINKSLAYGLTRNSISGPGFIPFWVGLALVLLSVLLLIQTFYRKDEARDSPIFDRESFLACLLYVGGGVLVIVATKFLGLLLPVGIAVFFFSKLKGSGTWKKSVILAICTTAGIFVLFNLILHVDLPISPFGF